MDFIKRKRDPHRAAIWQYFSPSAAAPRKTAQERPQGVPEAPRIRNRRPFNGLSPREVVSIGCFLHAGRNRIPAKPSSYPGSRRTAARRGSRVPSGLAAGRGSPGGGEENWQGLAPEAPLRLMIAEPVHQIAGRPLRPIITGAAPLRARPHGAHRRFSTPALCRHPLFCPWCGRHRAKVRSRRARRARAHRRYSSDC
jgi:hypothetical protein